MRGELEEDAKLDIDTFGTDLLISDDDLREVLRLAKKTIDPFRSGNGNEENGVKNQPFVHNQGESLDINDDVSLPLIPTPLRDNALIASGYDRVEERDLDKTFEGLAKDTSCALEAFQSAMTQSMAEVNYSS